MRLLIIAVMALSIAFNFAYSQKTRNTAEEIEKRRKNAKEKLRDSREKARPHPMKKQKGYDSFEQALKEAADVKRLSLRSKKIETIPSEISKFKVLEVLDLSNNAITVIPKEIGTLQNLKVLKISRNKLSSIPLEIKNLQNLKILDLSSNNLTIDLPTYPLPIIHTLFIYQIPLFLQKYFS